MTSHFNGPCTARKSQDVYFNNCIQSQFCWLNRLNRIKHHTFPFRCLYPHCKPRFGADQCRPQGPGQALRGSVRAPGKVVMNRGTPLHHEEK